MFARRVAVIGTGYVGLTTGACLASLGHRVSCADLDRGKVERFRRGEIGIREDGLGELVAAGIAAGRLSFVVGPAPAPRSSSPATTSPSSATPSSSARARR